MQFTRPKCDFNSISPCLYTGRVQAFALDCNEILEIRLHALCTDVDTSHSL